MLKQPRDKPNKTAKGMPNYIDTPVYQNKGVKKICMYVCRSMPDKFLKKKKKNRKGKIQKSAYTPKLHSNDLMVVSFVNGRVPVCRCDGDVQKNGGT